MTDGWIKDPDAALDFEFDWSSWLATDETISEVVWTVDTGLTKGDTSNTDTTATIWLSGGDDDTTYKVACKITTSAGRTDERTIKITCRDR